MKSLSSLWLGDRNSDPYIIIENSFQSTYSEIYTDLQKEEYCWNKNSSTIKYECLILSKFFIDYALKVEYSHDLNDSQMKGIMNLSDYSFQQIHDIEYKEIINYSEMSKLIEKRLHIYRKIRESKKQPECWNEIFTELTGLLELNEINSGIIKFENGLRLMNSNHGLSDIRYRMDLQLDSLQKLIQAYELAEIVFPRAIRHARQSLSTMNTRKIQSSLKRVLKKVVNKD